MKKIIKLVSVVLLIMSVASCGKKTNKFTEEDLKKIHETEAQLKQQLVNKTWHYQNEPVRAVQFLDDGSYINFLSSGIRGADFFSGDDGTWDIKYCFYDGDTKYLNEENNKDRALEYYDYNVVVTYKTREGESKLYTETIAFESGDLILAGDRLYDGPSVIEKLPDNLSIFKELLNHAWYIDGMNSYALFFDNGYCFMTYGVFIDGSTNGAYVYKWGFDEGKGILYLMNHYQPEEVIYEDVQAYGLNGALHDDGSMYFQLVEVWSDGEVIFDMDNVDGRDDSAVALSNSYSKLKTWSEQHWESY